MKLELRRLLEDVAAGEIGPGIASRAKELLEAKRAPRARKRPEDLGAAYAHAAGRRRVAEQEREEIKRETWVACCARSRIDHHGALACEGCHRHATSTVSMEPHHLILGSRDDAPNLVMVLCARCHRLGPASAHRRPRFFAQTVVLPWAKAHGYTPPNRKEYRS